MAYSSRQSQRQKRKVGKEARQRKHRSDADAALRSWFEALGIETLWHKMTSSARLKVSRSRWPRPILEFEGSPLPEYWPTVQESLLSIWEADRSDMGSLACEKPTVEFITILYPMALALSRCCPRKPSEDINAFFTVLKQLAEACFKRACAQLEEYLADALRMFSRLDSTLFRVRVAYRDAKQNKKQVVFVVSPLSPQRRTFSAGGVTRKAYRLANEVSRGHAPWIAFPPAAGISEIPLPVYVQEHALSRVEERAVPDRYLDNRQELAALKALARHHLAESLRKPNIIRRNGRQLLIEYRWGKCRFGYLPCELADGALLIKSFLFLTMQTTPEARKLYQELGLSRSDIQWTQLDSFNTFVYTDIHRDPKLAEVLRRCGCGPLLDMAKHVREELVEKGVADALHNFIRPHRREPAMSL